MSKIQVTEQEWKEWLVHPVTQRFRQFLQELVEESKEAWANGSYTQGGMAETVCRSSCNRYTFGECVLIDCQIITDAVVTNNDPVVIHVTFLSFLFHFCFTIQPFESSLKPRSLHQTSVRTLTLILC